MQTILSLLISFLLATATFASPIFHARPIRKDMKDLGHSVGKMVGDITSPEGPSHPASSGWAAPSTWRGDKEWKALSTGSFPAPSASMPHKQQWHATGAAALSGSMVAHHVRMVPYPTVAASKKMDVPSSIGFSSMPKPTVLPSMKMSTPISKGSSFVSKPTVLPSMKISTPISKGSSFVSKPTVLPSMKMSTPISKGSSFVSKPTVLPSMKKQSFSLPTKHSNMPEAPHKTLLVDSTSGIWPSGASLPKNAIWPRGAAWPSSGAAFATAAPVATGVKADHKMNTTTWAFPTGTAPAHKSVPLETAPASEKPLKTNHPFVARPSGTAPSTAVATGAMPHEKEHMHMPTKPAEANVASTAAASAAPSKPAVTHSTETKQAVHKSPGSPCSPEEKSECHGESKLGHCEFNDGHWRWYWSDVEDGHYCHEGAVFKDSHSSWSSSPSWSSDSKEHSWSKRVVDTLASL